MITQGTIFTELLAESKRSALEQQVREAHFASLVASEAEDDAAAGLRAAVAGWLVRIAAHVDAAAARRTTAAIGR